MAVDDIALFDQREAVFEHRIVFGRETCDDVCPDGDIRPLRLHPGNDFDCLLARMASFHALQDQIVAGLQRQMDMRHHSWLAGDEIEQPLFDFDPVD